MLREEARGTMTAPGRAARAALAHLAASCGGASSLPIDGSSGTGGASAGASVSSSPLVGTWRADVGTILPGFDVEIVTFYADGSADWTTVESTGGCGGTVQVTGMQWSATATMLTTSGGTCTGGLTCVDGTSVPCTAEVAHRDTCSYTLTVGGSVLTVECGVDPGVVFKREG